MFQRVDSSSEKLKGFFWLLFITFALWLALTSSFDYTEVTCGVVVVIIVSLFGAKAYSQLGFPSLSIKMVLFLLIYAVVLFWEIIKANLDVAYRAVHPKMPIKPGIVTIKTELKSDIAKTILANSITLTPGTFTLDVIGDKLLIHWINVKTDNIDEATKLIGRRFEKYLRVIFA